MSGELAGFGMSVKVLVHQRGGWGMRVEEDACRCGRQVTWSGDRLRSPGFGACPLPHHYNILVRHGAPATGEPLPGSTVHFVRSGAR